MKLLSILGSARLADMARAGRLPEAVAQRARAADAPVLRYEPEAGFLDAWWLPGDVSPPLVISMAALRSRMQPLAAKRASRRKEFSEQRV